MTAPGFVRCADPWGRPVDVRADRVVLVEGAIDGGDQRGDLWAHHPPGPYQRITLDGGTRIYLNAELAADLLTALGLR